MDARTLCLGILTRGEASGYEIKKAIEEYFGYFLDVSHSAIYPALAELQREGLASCTEVQQSGKPDKKVYALTQAGRAALVEGVMRSPGRHRMRSEFLPLLLFSDYLTPERLAALLDERLQEWEAHKAKAELCQQECDHAPAGLRFATGMQLAALGAVCEYIRSNRDWLVAAAGTETKTANEDAS